MNWSRGVDPPFAAAVFVEDDEVLASLPRSRVPGVGRARVLGSGDAHIGATRASSRSRIRRPITNNSGVFLSFCRKDVILTLIRMLFQHLHADLL